MLFSINTKGTVVLHPDALKLCPEFASLDAKQTLFLILAVDYHSPYGQFDPDEQKRRAKAHVYGNDDIEPWKSQKMKKAMDLYMSLQYSPIREQRKTYQDKINTINDAIRESNNPNELKNYMATNKELRKELELMDKEILMIDEQESIQIFGKGKLSFLEMLIRNQAKHKEVIRKKNIEPKHEEIESPLASIEPMDLLED